MAKKGKKDLIKLESTGSKGTFKVRNKNAKKSTEKLVLKKYDPKLRKHVEWKETKIK